MIDQWTYMFKASGQYNNIQNVLVYFDQIIAEIPGPKRDLTLPALQEATRNSISIRRQHDSNRTTDGLLEISQLIQKVLETLLDDQNMSRNNTLNLISKLPGHVPELKKLDFTYGTLDCAIQLARAFGPTSVSAGLQQTIQRLVFDCSDGSDQYFRWKAVSSMNLVLSLAYKANSRPRLSSSYVMTVTGKRVCTFRSFSFPFCMVFRVLYHIPRAIGHLKAPETCRSSVDNTLVE